MEDDLTARIARALLRAAIKRGVLSYQRFHGLCGPSLGYAQRYAVLEKAVAAIGDVHALDYGVLLALDNGLPGDDYFRRLLRYRHDDYVVALGDPRLHRPPLKRKWALVLAERTRAYDDAMRRQRAEPEPEPEPAARAPGMSEMTADAGARDARLPGPGSSIAVAI